MLTCSFCGKICKHANSLRNHQRCCKLNPDRIITYLEAHYKTDVRITCRKASNQYIKALESNLPKPIMSADTKRKIAETISRQSAEQWTHRRRQAHSAAMRKAVLDAPESYTASNVCGRVKIYEFNGSRFHGRWEVRVAEWLYQNHVVYERKMQPIPYFWKNSWHSYFPDFYLPKYDVFIEVKGYETDRDRCKWAFVPNLLVFKSKELKQIKKGIGMEALLVGGNELIIRQRKLIAGSSPAHTTNLANSSEEERLPYKQ